MLLEQSIGITVDSSDAFHDVDHRKVNNRWQRQEIAHEVSHAVVNDLCKVKVNRLAVSEQTPFLEEGRLQVDFEKHGDLHYIVVVAHAHEPAAVILLLFLEDVRSSLDDSVQDAVHLRGHHEDEQHHANVLQVVGVLQVVLLCQVR